MSTIAEIKKPLGDILDVVEKTGKSLRTLLDALSETEKTIRGVLNPPDLFLKLYDILDAAFIKWKLAHDIETGDEKVGYSSNDLSARNAKEQVIFGVSKEGVPDHNDNTQQRSYRGEVSVRGNPYMVKLRLRDGTSTACCHV